MSRYMPQTIFDMVVVVNLMTEVAKPPNADRILNELIETYLRAYPSEERGQLKADIYTATHLNTSTVDLINKLCGVDVINKLYGNGFRVPGYVFSVLKRINKTIIKNDRAKKSVFRRIFYGTAFNYETQPQIDRVRRSRENIARAALAVITAELTRHRKDSKMTAKQIGSLIVLSATIIA